MSGLLTLAKDLHDRVRRACTPRRITRRLKGRPRRPPGSSASAPRPTSDAREEESCAVSEDRAVSEDVEDDWLRSSRGWPEPEIVGDPSDEGPPVRTDRRERAGRSSVSLRRLFRPDQPGSRCRAEPAL